MKVALYVWNVCRDVVLGKYDLDDIGLIISPTAMKNDADAHEACELFTKCSWYGFLTNTQKVELEQESFPIDKYQQYMRRNCEKAQEIFWQCWNSGKIFQPRLLVGRCVISFDVEGIFESIEDYIEYLEKEVNPRIVYHANEVNQKELIDALRSL